MDMALNYDFLIRVIINTVAIITLIKFCYYKFSQHRTNASSFMLFGMGVFLVTSLLHAADISMGFAFGLFAVFSMLRYRTESISIKDMTYLFLVIAIALLSAVSQIPHHELFIINMVICLLAFLLETSLVLPLYEEMNINYEKIENITPDKREQLLEDLEQRTGLTIKSIEVISTDFLKDTAKLKLLYAPYKKMPQQHAFENIEPQDNKS